MIPIFELEPHKGFGPAMLGSSREAARAAMAFSGFPMERPGKRSDRYCDSAVQIECDDKELVQFIGVGYSPRFKAIYRDVEIFGVGAEQLFHLIADADSTGPHEFDASEYLFPGQIVTLWDANNQYDYLGHESQAVWAQVGLGNATYLASIAKFRGNG